MTNGDVEDSSHEYTVTIPDDLMNSGEEDDDYFQMCARADWWVSDKFQSDLNIVRKPLTDRGETLLHIAVVSRSTTFVEKCVQLLSPQDQLIRKSDGMLPVHLAALTGQHKMVHDFTSQIQLDNMDYQDIEKLFFTTVRNNMFDVAMKLFKKYPLELTTARDEEKLTALHMLARKPSEILRSDIYTGGSTSVSQELLKKLWFELNPELKIEGENDAGGSISMGMELFKKLWLEVRKLKNDKFVKLITEPSAVLFDSIKSGNVKGTKYLLDKSREPVMTIKEPITGRNLLHLLVLYRHFDSFLHCLNCGKEHLVRPVDNEANNVLHMAAHHPPQFRSFSGLRANLQMQRELAWFKKVERNVPRELRSVRNNNGKRPIDVFYDEHKQLSEEIKGEAKDMANYGMLVAILVATVAFAAVLTVPGDKNNIWFIVFILTNAVALFTSSASILSFLSNFTSSRFSQSEFVISIHPSLTLGRVLLIISVAAMVVAFTAASFLIFHQKTKWVSYVVASMGVFPLLLFLLFQFSVFDFIWSRYYRVKLE